MKEARNNIRLASLIDNLHYTIGVHPHDADKFKDEDLVFLESNARNPKCFGFGEIGLDFNAERASRFPSRDVQIATFTKQLELAKRLNVKVYMHCRDAFDTFIQIVKQVGHFNGIVHCFTGTLEHALEFTSLGFKLGITGWIVDKRRNADLVRAISDPRITLDMLLVETDAPYMPVNRKTRSSTPPDTAVVVQEIAKLKNLNVIQCGKQLYVNALNFL